MMPVVVLYYRNRDHTHFWVSNWPLHFWGQIFSTLNSTNSHHSNSTLIFRPFYAVINIRSSLRWWNPSHLTINVYRVDISPWAAHYCFPLQPFGRKKKKCLQWNFFLWRTLKLPKSLLQGGVRECRETSWQLSLFYYSDYRGSWGEVLGGAMHLRPNWSPDLNRGVAQPCGRSCPR